MEDKNLQLKAELDDLVLLQKGDIGGGFAVLLVWLVLLEVENPDELRGALHNDVGGDHHDSVVKDFENKETDLTGPELPVVFVQTLFRLQEVVDVRVQHPLHETPQKNEVQSHYQNFPEKN